MRFLLFLFLGLRLIPLHTQATPPPTQPLEQHKLVRRAAFDIGSGGVKFQVSDVDLRTNTIAHTLLVRSASVPLKDDLLKSPDGNLSLEIQERMIQVISQLVQEAETFHPEAYHGIATEGMRLAKNGPFLAERIQKETGVPVTIISQEEEGLLAFASALNEIAIDPEKAVVWDFGGASFQITTRQNGIPLVYEGKMGKLPLKTALLTLQGRTSDLTLSPNPISKADLAHALEWIENRLSDFPDALRQKLQQTDVVLLGVGIHPLWAMPDHTYYDSARLWQEITSRLDLDDAALCAKDSVPPKNAAYLVSNLIFAYGIMEHLQISQVHYVGTEGANAIGALLSPNYWRGE